MTVLNKLTTPAGMMIIQSGRIPRDSFHGHPSDYEYGTQLPVKNDIYFAPGTAAKSNFGTKNNIKNKVKYFG